MTENSVAQFSRLARELLNVRSEEWNSTRISNKTRLSSFLFFLRNRGHELLQKVVDEKEPVNDPEFTDLIIHTVVCLCRLPVKNLPQLEPQLERRSRTISKSQRKKESKKAKCEKRPMIKPFHRVLQSALEESDCDHDYSLILANSTQIIQRVSYPGILYLRPISDLLRNLAAAHGDRVKIAYLIALFSNLREQIACDRIVIEDGSQTVKMMMELISLAKLLLLDGEDNLGLNVILIMINVLRRVQLDHLFSASWSYMLNLKLLELTPLSKFTNIPLLKDVLEQIHSAELILRRRINSILSGNTRASAVFPIQHWNGEHAEKQFSLALQTKDLSPDQSSDICLFAKFTKAMLVLINICSAELLDFIKNLLSQSFNCCCLTTADIFSKISEQRFSFLPYLLARCEQPKCPRCVTRDSKIWAPLSQYTYSKINSEEERVNYFTTIHHLTSVLPKNANRLLLDNLLLPILSQNLDQLGRSTENESKLQTILDSIGNTLSSITFAPLGLFKTFLKMLKKVDVEGTKMVLPILTSSMKVSTSNQVESLEQQKLAKEIILIFCRSTKAVVIDDVGNLKMENDQPVLNPSEALLTTDCLFYLTQLYEGIAHSDLLRKTVFKNLQLKDVIKNLLGQSIFLVGDPSIAINAAGDSSYICIPKHHSMPLTTRMEIFSVLLGLYTFFTSYCHLQWPTFETAVLPEIASDFVSNTKHLKLQVINNLTKVLEASLEPKLKSTKKSPRKNHRRNRSIILDLSAIESSEAPLTRSPPPETAKTLKNTRTVIFPCIIKFVFTIFGLFWEDQNSTEELPGLVPLLENVLSLLHSQKNVEICAKHNVVLLVLQKFDFLLDTEDNSKITKLMLELFSKSSRHYVSPAALQLVLNKLTRPRPPITDITTCLKDLFETTSKVYASMQIPITIDKIYNNLFDISGTSDWNNSAWNRGIIHQEMRDFFKKKESISWTFCFWLFGDHGEVHSDETWNPELHDNDSSESLSTSDNGLVILQEEIYDLNFMNGTHIASFGESDYMLQLWIEGSKFQLRIVTDNRDGKPPGILAKQEVDIDLKKGRWDHVSFSAKETRAALKGHFAFEVVIQLNLATVFETSIEFPQLAKTRKSLRWQTMQWVFGDSRREEANEVFENTFRVSGCKIFRGRLMADEIIALYLLGPDNQDLTLTTGDETTSPFNPSMTTFQHEFLKYNIEVENIDLEQSLTFRPNLNVLREKIFLSWNAKSPESLWLFGPVSNKGSLFQSQKAEPFQPISQKARVIRAPLLQGQIRADRSAALDSAVYQLGGVRPFLLLFSNSMTPICSSSVQIESLFVLLSAIRLNNSFARDFHQLKGHLMVKQVIQAGNPYPDLLRTLVEFACHGRIFDDNGNILHDTSAVITDTAMLNHLILDCNLWCVDPKAWALQFEVLKALVHDNHKYRAFNVKTLVQAGAVLKLLETLQIALSERPKMEMPLFVGNMMVDLIRALIGYPPDTQIIAKVFDFCCSVHPPSEAYVTNTRKKFYFYPRFESAHGSQSMQTKLERSQSLDALPSATMIEFEGEKVTSPKLIRSHSAFCFRSDSSYLLDDATKRPSPFRSRHLKKELFRVDILDGTPSDDFLEHSDPSPVEGQSPQPINFSGKSSDNDDSVDLGECRGATNSVLTNEWDVLRRTNSDASAGYVLTDGTANLVNGLLEVLRHAVVLLPDTQIKTVLNDVVINWETLVVLANSNDDSIRCASLRLFHDYLQRASVEIRHQIVRGKAFMLFANQLYQHQSTAELVESALLLISSRAEPLLEATSGSVRELDPTALPAVAPLIALLENAVGDDFVLDLVCMNIRNLFEAHDELGDTMMDRGLSIVLCNAIAKQVSTNEPVSPSLLGLLHSVTIRCATTNTEHFRIMSDIIESLAHLELKEIELDEDTVDYTDEERHNDLSSTSDTCDACARVAEIRRVLFSVYLVAIESLMKNTDLGLSELQSEEVLAADMFTSPEKMPNSNMSTPKKQNLNISTHNSPTKLKISEIDLITRVGVLFKSATSKILCQGPSRCRHHNDLLSNELISKYSQRSGMVPSTPAKPDNVDNDSAFAIHIFDILLYWSSEASKFDTKIPWITKYHHKETSLNNLARNYSRKSKLARRLMLKLPLSEQFVSLINFMLSPQGGKARLVPLKIVKEPERKNILLFIFNGAEAEAEQVQLYLHYLLFYHSANMEQNDIDDLDQLVVLMSQLGYDPPSNGPSEIKVSEAKQRVYEKKRAKLRTAWLKQGDEQFRQIVERAFNYSDHIATSSSEVTQVVVNRQNILRRRLISLVKAMAANDVKSRDVWRKIISQLNHERAVWHNVSQTGMVWQLSPSEGPYGERRRLERANPRIKSKFVRSISTEIYDALNEPDSMKSLPMMNFLKEDPAEDNKAVIEWLHIHEQITNTEKCRKITPEHEANGELLLSPTKMFYVGDEPLSSCFVARGLIDESGFCKHWEISSVKRLNRRWFGLIDCALEIAFNDGRTEMFAFSTFDIRENVYSTLSKLSPPEAPGSSLQEMTSKWQKGEISNFAYLMALNTFAGRTFNDLMQYPVFPFILKNYTEEMLDLSSCESYRNLMVPISVQNDEKREMFQERYHFLSEEFKRNPEATAPYHYGSHYSNSGTVLHFLLRLPPFTKMFLEYQDQSFDLPDRTFHSIATAWNLASNDSATDVKELVPEFFFLPEFLLNNENFNFGIRQNGKRVHHVTLPPWCNNDARMFISIHRQALESAHVSSQLHHWIDLVFGHKQTGSEAIKACNVFHPMTYFGVDVASETDPVKRTALETMIKTYGQTPKQLFTSPHPHRAKADIESLKKHERAKDALEDGILANVSGLKWGNWCGSPTLTPPIMILKKAFNSSAAVHVTAFSKTDCAVLPPNTRLVGNSLLSFDHDDRILRLKTGRTKINLLKPEVDDQIVCAEPVSKSQFIIGFATGIIQIWNLETSKTRPSLLDGSFLIGHSDRIHAFAVCPEFSIIVSASEDGSAIIWDLNSRTYIRSLQGHPAGVNCVATATQTGEIVTVCSKDDERHSQLRLWTINGQLVAACDAQSPVLCTKWTNAVEGRACNAVITGHVDGSIHFWSSIDLSHVRSLSTTAASCISIALSESGGVLFTLGSDGLLSVWAQSENQRETRKPLVVSFEKTA